MLHKIKDIQPYWRLLTDNAGSFYLQREINDDMGTTTQTIDYYPKTNTASIKVKTIVLEDARAAYRFWRDMKDFDYSQFC